MYLLTARFADAEPPLRRAVGRRAVLPRNDIRIATSLNNLAGAVFNLGRHDEAETLYLQGAGDL